MTESTPLVLPRWGTVSTIKSPLAAIQRFAAWHLSLGAHRVYVYLDDDAPETLVALKAHPKLRVMHTDAAYWAKRKGRPDKHQVRQTVNARHANMRRQEVDWLVHIDVDEFLLPAKGTEVAQLLAPLPDAALCARVRPVEALAPGAASRPGMQLFKAFHLDQAARQRAAMACFPTWGRFLSGGFLSHVAGKLFFRAGTQGLQIRIHNVTLDAAQNPGQVELHDLPLGHFHADSWANFLAAYRFRLARGSYRAELKPQVRQPGAVNLHDLFASIEAEGGEDALRAFFDEVCAAEPALCDALDKEGLLVRREMDLDALVQRHFG